MTDISTSEALENGKKEYGSVKENAVLDPQHKIDSEKGKKALVEIRKLKSKIETAIRIAEGTPSATYNIATNLNEGAEYLKKAVSILG
jgi:hypothetical protein